MPFVDLHCDTISILTKEGGVLCSNELNVSVEKLKAAGVLCQFFAMFVRMTEFSSPDDAYEYVKKMYAVFIREMVANRENLAVARCADEIEKNRKAGKISAVLTVEEGGVLNNEIDRVQELYDMGVRLITLTWNFENALGYPNSDDPAVMSAGLKPFGKEVVERMNRLGMLIDVSHLSDGGFWDVARLSKAPFVASHSNARAVTNFRRNLSDDMLRALAEKGGVTGINFYHKFLGEDGTGSVAQMVEHVKHIRQVAGIDVIAIGSDFDGFAGPCEIRYSSELMKLTDALSKSGFTDGEIEKICCKNALRVIKNVF